MVDLIEGVVKVIGSIMMLILIAGLAGCQPHFFQSVNGR